MLAAMTSLAMRQLDKLAFEQEKAEDELIQALSGNGPTMISEASGLSFILAEAHLMTYRPFKSAPDDVWESCGPGNACLSPWSLHVDS